MLIINSVVQLWNAMLVFYIVPHRLSAFKDLSTWNADVWCFKGSNKMPCQPRFLIPLQSRRFAAYQRSLVIVCIPPTRHNDFHQRTRARSARNTWLSWASVDLQRISYRSTKKIWHASQDCRLKSCSQGPDEGLEAVCVGFDCSIGFLCCVRFSKVWSINPLCYYSGSIRC